jgi:hypothetical protein
MVVTTQSGTLNVNQVYNLLLQNGATNQEAANLAGIATWEAGGGNPNAINSQAINPNAPDYSVGLFQYNFRYPPGFNAGNPLASTRGGFSANQLLGDLNAQAQSALALLRGSGHNYATQWSVWTPHFANIQSIASQLLGGANVGGVTDVQPPETGTGGTTATGTGVQDTTGLQPSVTATAGSSPGAPTGLDLNFNESINHSIMQILLVLFGLVLLIGGIYLIGSRK